MHDPGDGTHVDGGKHVDVADAAHHGAHDDHVHELHDDVHNCDAGGIHDERERDADDDLGDDAHVDDIDDIDDEHNDVPDADVRAPYHDNHALRRLWCLHGSVDLDFCALAPRQCPCGRDGTGYAHVPHLLA